MNLLLRAGVRSLAAFLFSAALVPAASAQQLSIGDVSIAEGNSLTKVATFTVTLSASRPGPVLFDVATADGSATAGSDYVAKSTAGVRIPAGTTSKQFTVTINGDATAEPNETFYVNLSNASGASIADAQAVGTITNDDASPLPTISLFDTVTTEDTIGIAALVFEARLSAPAATDVTFNFNTTDGSATIADHDYEAQSLLLRIPAGRTSVKFPVVVNGDAVPEPSEVVNGTISNVVGATVADATATGMILNDDGIVQLTLTPLGQASSGTAGPDSKSSADGRFVVFVSDGEDLLGGQSSASGKDVFLRDMRSGETRLVSVGLNGATANGISYDPSISKDGRFIAFGSVASNLVALDGNGAGSDIFVRDMQLGATTLVTVPISGTGANGGNELASISADGRYVSFESLASNLVANDSNGATSDIFVRDLQAGTTTMVSRALGGVNAGNGSSYNARISANGRYVTFASTASDLVAGDGNITDDIFVWDLQTNTISRASVSSAGVEANGFNGQARISADGRFVVYSSSATNLGGSPPAGGHVIYVRDTVAGTTEPVSVTSAGGIIPNSSVSPSISDDGRYVAFAAAGAGDAQDTNGKFDVYVHDRQAHTTLRLSTPFNGTPATNDHSNEPSISPDGRFVTFDSVSSLLVPGDGNGKVDTFRAPVPEDSSLPKISVVDTWLQEEGDTGVTHKAIAVSLSAPAGSAVSFDLDTSDGIAIAGSDYVPLHLTGQTIAAGQTSKTIVFDVMNEDDDEEDESLEVHLGNVRGARLGDTHATMIIGDDDTGPGVPSLSIADVAIVEGDPGTKSATFTVSLSAPASAAVTFDIATANGTAAAGNDYVALALSNQSIPIGATSKTFNVIVNGDYFAEANETFAVNVTNVVGATVVDGSATGTITNDDATPILTIDDGGTVEGNSGTQWATFIMVLSGPVESPTTFDITTSNGSAVAGSDYTPLVLHYEIPAGTYGGFQFHVDVLGDTQFESDETFNVSLSNLAGGAVLGDGQAVGTIQNDDPDLGGAPSLSIADVSVVEGNSGWTIATFTLSLSAPLTMQMNFQLHVDGVTATAFEDFDPSGLNGWMAAGETSRTFEVMIKGDNDFEPDETFTVTAENVEGANVADGVAVGTIVNDDAVAPTMSIGDASVSEGNSGLKTMTLPVTLSKPAPVQVCFLLQITGGTATVGSDYQDITVQPCIPAGQSSYNFNVSIIGDTVVEPNETFTVNASNVSGATVLDGSAIGTITNDDTGSGPTLSIADVSIAEGNSGTKTATFTVTLSQTVSGPVIFDIATANGTATAGSDYVAKTTNGLRIAAGQTSKTFVVTINGDTTSEPNETFTVNLSNASGATIGDGQAVGTITNDDAAATPTLSIADASVSEGNSGTKVLTFTVSLSPAAAGTVSYDIATSNGTATAGSDYVASTLTGQSITAGGTSKTFAVTINGDANAETDETFTVTLTNVSGATLGDGSAVGTITNDDGGSGPTVSIGDVSMAEGQLGTKQATFTVTLSAAASTAVSYTIATADGTAVSPSDYTAKSMTAQSIPAGTLSKTFVVAVKGDKVAEPNETFTVNLSAVTGATVADGQAIGTITNDDAAALSIARFDARGLVDDIDDGNREPVLTTSEYATLLLDTAKHVCERTGAATVVGVDGIESAAVLRDLADTTNATCANSRYQAAMGEGAELGFLVEATASTDARGAQVLGEPASDATAKLSALQVQGSGHAGPITLLLPQAPPVASAARTTQLRNLGRYVQAQRKADPQARIVLIGGVTVPGLLDLTARSLPAKSVLPGERVLVSPTLLDEFGKSAVAFPTLPSSEPPAQVLQLQR